MTDPLRKPTSGEPFNPSAKQFGMFIDAARFADESKRQIGGFKKSVQTPCHVRVRNATGSPLTAMHPVVGLGSVVLSTGDRESVVYEDPTFAGEVPDEHTNFAILPRPCAPGEIVPSAVILGRAWVRVKVNDAFHEFATLEDGRVDRLQSAASGPAQILWMESTSEDVRWAVVLIASSGGGDRHIRFRILSMADEFIANVEILSRACRSSDSGEVLVYDPSGCHFRGSDEDLIGREGGATLMEPLDEATYECRWEVDWLCCPTRY